MATTCAHIERTIMTRKVWGTNTGCPMKSNRCSFDVTNPKKAALLRIVQIGASANILGGEMGGDLDLDLSPNEEPPRMVNKKIRQKNTRPYAICQRIQLALTTCGKHVVSIECVNGKGPIFPQHCFQRSHVGLKTGCKTRVLAVLD